MKRFFEKILDKIKKEELLSRIIKAIGFGAGGAVISKGLLMIFNIIIARILTEQDYGAYSLINNTVQTFIVFAGAGIGVTLTRYVALYRNKNKNIAGVIMGTLLLINIIISLIVALIVFIFSDKIAMLLNSDINITNLLKITSATIFFTSVVSILQGTLQGFEKYKRIAFIQVLSNILNLIIGMLLANFFGIIGAVISLLVLQIIMFLVMQLTLNNVLKEEKIKLKCKFIEEIKKAILKVTIPSFLATIFVIPLMWFTNFFFSSRIGLEEFGAFSVCIQWFNIINYIPQQFGQLKPIYTQLYDNGEFKKLKKYLNKIILTAVCFSVICTLLFILARNVILLGYGKFYTQFGLPFSIMMIATVLFAIQSQYGSVFQAIGKSWICFILNLVWAISYIIMFFIFYSKGAIGYAYTYLISYTIYAIISSMVFYNIIKSTNKCNINKCNNRKDD